MARLLLLALAALAGVAAQPGPDDPTVTMASPPILTAALTLSYVDATKDGCDASLAPQCGARARARVRA